MNFGTNAKSCEACIALSKATSFDSSGSQKNENSEVVFGREETGDELILVEGAI